MGKFGRLLAAVTLIGVGLLGTGSPAYADATTVEFTDACGAVSIRIIGAAGEEITYSRNGEVFATFIEALADGSGLAGVHADGDELIVTVDGTPFPHTYDAPDGCTLPPKVTFEVEDACQGISVLKVNNTGTTPAANYRLRLDSGAPELMDPLQPGETIIPVDANKVQVTGPLGAVAVLWLLVDVEWSEVKGCHPDTLTAVFEDTCDGVKVTVTSTFRVTQGYLVVKMPGTLVDVGYVASGTPSVHNVPAAAGDEVAVYYPTGEDESPEALRAAPTAVDVPGYVLIGSHVHVKPSCGGGGLPVTGFQVGLAAGVGLLLVAGGAVLFVITRRRRFEA